MADLDFFLDPVCPWAWITSRWVVEVQHQRGYDVEWRFISLAVLNERLVADWYTPDYRRGHVAGLECLRVADAVRLETGNGGVGQLYTALGTAIHNGRQRQRLRDDTAALLREALVAARLDPDLAVHHLDAAHDEHLREETATALARAGDDVGTPIITFRPGADDEASFFGPVISSIPRGERAVQLWDAIDLIASTSGVSELKRTVRGRPSFD